MTRVRFTILSSQGYSTVTPPRASVNEIVFLDLQPPTCDTDNDGIPNHLDLDSDGDGCPDAREGAGNFNPTTIASGTIAAQTPNANFGTVVNTTTGVPTAVGAGQSVGQSQDASKNDCLDSDGDGVPNWHDLDDDNDGILDVTEGVVDNDNILEWGYNWTGDAPSIFNSTVISAAQNVTKGSGLTAQIFDGQTSYSVSGVGATTISQSISNNSYFQFKFTTANFPNTMQYLYDRFSLYVRPPSEYPTYKMRLYISADNFATSTDISGEVAYPIVPYEDRVVFPLTSPYNLAPNKSYTLRLYFYDVSGGASATFSHDDFQVLTTQYADTDGDGIPNHLDLDSDNDGCVDAFEGDENVTVAQLVNASGTVTVGLGSTANNQNLGVTVNANGIPTVVNSGGDADIGGDQGQGVGSSQNQAINACPIESQCVTGDCNNNAFLNTSNPNTLEYDNLISGFHSSIAKQKNGNYLIWGQGAKPNTFGENLYEPTEITPANGFNYTGKILKATLGTRGATNVGSDQYAILTTDGLYIWGGGDTFAARKDGMVHSGVKSTQTFDKITNANISNAEATSGLPIGVSPTDVKMMFGSYATLAIVTCTGYTYILSHAGNKNGDGSTDTAANQKKWHRVMIDAATPLNRVVAMRGVPGAMLALTYDGDLYTWGTETYLGNGTAKTNRLYATKMTLPAGVVPKMIGMTKASTGTTGVTLNSYYLLSTTGDLYSLGDNSKKQLGTFDTVEKTSWVNVKSIDASTNMTNIAWISPNEHDAAGHAAVTALTTDGKLWGWGMNNGNMLGTGASGSVDPRYMFGGLAATEKILAIETGGHINTLFKDCDFKLGYIGHNSNGSYAIPSASSSTVFQFDGARLNNLCAIYTPPYPELKNLKTCAGNTVDLANALLNTTPAGYTLEWWTTSNRVAGTQVLNTAAVSAGTYYAFYISNTNECTNITGETVLVSNYIPTDPEYATCICFKDPVTSGASQDTKMGITLLQRAGAENTDNWPMVRKGGHIALESNTQGFVITRIAKANLGNIANPQDGMMVFDTTDKCLKIYSAGAWKCFQTPTCP